MNAGIDDPLPWRGRPAAAPAPSARAVEPDELFSPARLPGLGAAGRAMLTWLREHPAAPIYRNHSGHRLGLVDRWRARVRHSWLRHAAIGGPYAPGSAPPWAWWFMARRSVSVPAAPAWQTALRGWRALPTMSRADLQARLADFVPPRLQSPRLVCFTTSGTTGHPIRVPSTPLAAAAYQALHERALALHGVRLRAGAGDVGVVLAGFQQRCFTYVSVNPLRGECGLAKINLHPREWRHPEDRVRYLDALRPELITGDPVSLSELARLPLAHRPRALLSTSMALSDGLRLRLSQRFGCPVLDVYSMNEAGPIAVYVPAVQAHVLLQPRLFVEICDAAGQALPEGALGEVTLTGGINPCLPLLRYRTGDHARLVHTPLGPALRDLQGRPPVRFRHAATGAAVNNVEVTQALGRLPLRRWALHQRGDGTLVLRVDIDVPEDAMAQAEGQAAAQAAVQAELRTRLVALLGPWPLHLQPLDADDKVVQYTSDLPGAAP